MKQICEINHFIGILAGKGGVGKSTVAVNLALALQKRGKKVGILDADIYGPSIQKMVKTQVPPMEEEGRIIPAQGLGILYISSAFFQMGPMGSFVRAPLVNQMVIQFVEKVAWGKLDYVLIDFPPGTGDIQITLMQQLALSGAIGVTTPQEMALIDVRKSMDMVQMLEVPLLGIIENMSYFPSFSGKREYVFGRGGGEKLAREFNAPLIGEVPIDPMIAHCADQGLSLFECESQGGPVFEKMAQELEKMKMKGEKEIGSFELIWDREKGE